MTPERPTQHTGKLIRNVILATGAVAVAVGLPALHNHIKYNIANDAAGFTWDIHEVPQEYVDLVKSIDERLTPIKQEIFGKYENKNLMGKLKLSEEQYKILERQAVSKIDKQLEILTAERASGNISVEKSYDDGTDNSNLFQKWISLKTALSVDPILPVPILLGGNGMPVINPETGKAMLADSPEATAYLRQIPEENPKSFYGQGFTDARVLATGRRSDPSDAPIAEDILINPETGKPISAWFSFETANALQEVLIEKTISELAAQPLTIQ